MGATMPMAAQLYESNLGLRRPGLLAWLFCINAAGSVAGAVVSNGTTIPQLGLSLSMGFAAALNLLAGMVLCALCKVAKGKTAAVQPSHISGGRLLDRRNRIPGITGFLAMGLGFCSLRYEIHQFLAAARGRIPGCGHHVPGTAK